ncbi:MAG: GAF domain-containing sensor histidine kinase [Anaerolineales bacterium]|nr:GAF domain-containing sensor histidine kinase [Anaerolineales bacterium]
MEPDYKARYEAEKLAREQAETLAHMAALLNAKLDLDASLSAICDQTAHMLNVPIVTISLYNETRQELRLAYQVGLPAQLQQSISTLPREVYDQYTQESGRIVVVDDIQTFDNLPNIDIYRQMDLHTTINISMLFNEQLIGRLNIGTLHIVRHFTPWEISLLRGIADLAAIAIHRATLHERVQNYARELEERVQARTADLAASNQAKEAALKALQQHANELEIQNAELDAFAHTVAHDLRNPLGSLIGYAEMLLEDDLIPPNEQTFFLERILHQSHKMHTIIHEILLLASLRKTEVEAEPITDMRLIIHEALSRMENLVTQAQAEIVLPTDWPVVCGHAAWIEEVWANYLSNALKYGGEQAQLVVETAVLPGNWARYGVRDNGRGLTETDMSRLFTPFTQLHQIQLGGHGLGLSIVRRILDKLGGRVGVNSQLGNGSFFYFELPLADNGLPDKTTRHPE